MTAAGQQQPPAQPVQQQAPLVLQGDRKGDTSEEDGDEEEGYDEEEEEQKEKDGAEDGQVEEVSFYKSFEKKRHSSFTFAKHANYMLFFSPNVQKSN